MAIQISGPAPTAGRPVVGMTEAEDAVARVPICGRGKTSTVRDVLRGALCLDGIIPGGLLVAHRRMLKVTEVLRLSEASMILLFHNLGMWLSCSLDY